MKIKRGLKAKVHALALTGLTVIMLALLAWESVHYQNKAGKANKEEN